MFYTYLLRSESHPTETYIGSTSDLRSRLPAQNSGKSPHTKKFIPWKLLFYAAFPKKPLAEKLERYLKKRLRPRFHHATSNKHAHVTRGNVLHDFRFSPVQIDLSSPSSC
jgi:predicted GIY-YIG superfamily endonuclease